MSEWLLIPGSLSAAECLMSGHRLLNYEICQQTRLLQSIRIRHVWSLLVPTTTALEP